MKKCVTCAQCLALLETDKVIFSLQKRKQYGNLIRVSKLIECEACKCAEKYFRFFLETSNIFNSNNKTLIKIIINNTMGTLRSAILSGFGNHLFDDDPIDGHSFFF